MDSFKYKSQFVRRIGYAYKWVSASCWTQITGTYTFVTPLCCEKYVCTYNEISRNAQQIYRKRYSVLSNFLRTTNIEQQKQVKGNLTKGYWLLSYIDPTSFLLIVSPLSVNFRVCCEIKQRKCILYILLHSYLCMNVFLWYRSINYPTCFKRSR